MLRLPIAIATALLCLPYAAFADTYADSPSCYKPSKPFEFTSQWEVDSFRADVDAYRYCIENFIEEQQSQINEHQEAINNAIDEWNHFVNWELN